MRRSLLGRETETERVLRWARAPGAVLTLVGPPGVGKTAIASFAHRLLEREGVSVLFVRLTRVVSEEDADAMMADRVSRLQREGPHVGGSDVFGVPGWVRAVGQLRSPVLIIDGCESDRSGAARLGELFLDASNGSVIATSRERLDVVGEELLRIKPLETPRSSDPRSIRASPAVELLGCETADAEAVLALREIASRVDGLPAALLLCASLLETATPQQLVERLRELPSALAIDDIVRTSWAPLEPDLKHLLLVASVLEGQPTLELLEASVRPELSARVLRLLDQLARKSLVERMERDEAADASPRFRVLSVVRAFALAQSDGASSERGEIEERLVAYVERAPAEVAARQATELLELVERRIRTRRVDSVALRALQLISPVLALRGEHRRIGDLVESALALAPPSPLAIALRAQLAFALLHQLRPNDAFVQANRVMDASRAHEDPTVRRTGWLVAADIHSRLFRAEEAQRALEEASNLARDDDRARLEVLVTRARVEWRSGTLEPARAAAGAALAIAERLGMRQRACVLRLMAAQTLEACGASEEAARFLERAITGAAELGLPAIEAVAHTSRGLALARRGELEPAAASLETAYRQASVTGSHRDALWALTYLGVVRFLRGEAATVLEEAALRTPIDEPVLLLIPLFATIAGSTLARSLVDDGLRRLRSSYGDAPWLERFSAAVTACLDRTPEAIEPLARALPPAFQPDLLLCRSMSNLTASHAVEVAPRLRVAEDASWFALGADAPTPIGASPTTRRILAALVAAHTTKKPTLTLEALREAAWPGDKSQRDAAANRVYVALSRLRDRGLRDVVERDGAGWRLRRGTLVEIVATGDEAGAR